MTEYVCEVCGEWKTAKPRGKWRDENGRYRFDPLCNNCAEEKDLIRGIETYSNLYETISESKK